MFSTAVAKELSGLFPLAEEDAFAFLDSLFGANSEEELNDKLKHFGIEFEDEFVEETEKPLEIIERKEEVEQISEHEEKAKRTEEPVEEESERPRLPPHRLPPKRSDLIDPNEFVFHAVEKHTPYLRTEGAPSYTAGTIKLKKGRPEGTKGRYKPSERFSRKDAEAIALEMVMRFEEVEAREPDDRHTQRSIGYDIYSETEAGKQRFIEVKHFRGEPGTFELTSYQWKKAESEKDRYFVYIVSGLKKGGNPQLGIIQNPVKYLVPDPAVRKKFSSWKNGVKTIVRLKKV